MTIHPSELPTPEELEAFFFEGMCENGWSSPTPVIKPHPHLIGWKQTFNHKPFGDGHMLFLTDSWGDGQGLTEIKLRLGNVRPKVARWAGSEILLWVMRYKHKTIFLEESLPYITSILHAAYSKRQFFGGRGETSLVPRTNVCYWNECLGSFTEFSGREELWGRSNEDSPLFILNGDTEYWGGLAPG